MNLARAASAAFCLAVLSGCAAEPCRVGIDFGSSGIRAERQGGGPGMRAEIPYLQDVWADGLINDSVEPTVAALGRMREGMALPSDCRVVGGGYSAWRLAAEKGGPAALALTLAELRDRTGVSLIVIPPAREGAHAFAAVQAALGGGLRTEAILDVGGGSLQVATRDRGAGVPLGQNSWRREFCLRLRPQEGEACRPNPVGAAGEAAARIQLAELTAPLGAMGRFPVLTAVSAPVARGILPILRRLGAGGRVDAGGFDRQALDSAVAALRDLDDGAILARLDGCGGDCAPRFVGTFVTDMLLVRGVMEALGTDRLEVIEAPVNNAAGLPADARVQAWAEHYGCYLERFARRGTAAFDDDPAQCPAETAKP